jgi:RNA polymerase sigma-70 factor (sigma-E family)
VSTDSVDSDFAAYVAGRWDALVRSAVYLGCSREDAEDLVQTTLVRCYRHWERVRRARQVDAYVHRSLVNAHRKARSRRWTGEVPTEKLPDSATTDGTSSAAARADLHSVLRSLSVDHRTVLVLRFVADLTEQQTADVLNIPVGTVKSRAARALAAIDRAALQEETP